MSQPTAQHPPQFRRGSVPSAGPAVRTGGWRLAVVPRCTFHAALLLLLVPSLGAAQNVNWDPSATAASRASLDSLAHRLELSAESPAYSTALRAEAKAQAEALRTRLRDGDFQVGDRIVLNVERETTLSDTFAVEQGPTLQLPTIGQVSLGGVLRSELEHYLTGELGRYIRQPVVRARSLVRVSITGEVGKPGFYMVPSELPLTSVLALAGQVTPRADIAKIQIERGNNVLWDAAALGAEIIGGRTLDQLGVRAGDRVIVGGKPRALGSFEGSARTILLLFTLPAAVTGIIAVFRH